MEYLLAEAPQFTREDPPYCRNCKRAVDILYTDTKVKFQHTEQTRGKRADHIVELVKLSELPDAIIKCDFCSSLDARWQYTFDEQADVAKNVTAQYVGLKDYRSRHNQARVTRRDTDGEKEFNWGEYWTACSGCADAIDAGDLMALVRRVCDSMPTKYTRSNRIAGTRARMIESYEPMFASRKSDRQPLPGRA